MMWTVRIVTAVGMLILWMCPVYASSPETAGIMGENGGFQPKVVVSQDESSVTVRKLNPKDRFTALEVRFVFPGVESPSATRGLHIQWEKKPHVMGKQWPLEDQRTFQNESKTYHSAWTDSPSFTIADKSGEETFRRYSWDRIVQIKLNGKLLQPTKQIAPTETPFAAVSDGRPDDWDTVPSASPQEDQPAASSHVTESDASPGPKDLEGKYQELLTRTANLENSVASLRHGREWGSILALVVLGLTAGVAVGGFFLAPLLGGKTPAIRTLQYDKLRIHSGCKVPNAS